MHPGFNGSVCLGHADPVTWERLGICVGSAPGSDLMYITYAKIVITSLTAPSLIPTDKAKRNRKLHYRPKQFTPWLENIKLQTKQRFGEIVSTDSAEPALLLLDQIFLLYFYPPRGFFHNPQASSHNTASPVNLQGSCRLDSRVRVPED